MAKFENYRYKALTALEKTRDCLWKIAGREKQREDQKFSSFRFLEYAGLDIESAVERDNRAAFKNARAVLVISILMTAIGFMLSSNGESLADVLQRPEYGEGSKEAQIEVTIEAGGMKQSSLVPIKIKEKALTAAEASAMFDSCEEWLRTSLFEGQPPYKLNDSINLPKQSEDGLVQIVWESSREDLISSAGKINTLGLKVAEITALKAVLMAEDFSRELYFSLSAEPSETSLTQSLKRELSGVISNLDTYLTEDRLNLPNSSPKGAHMTWVLPRRQVPVFIIFFGLFMALAIFFSRHDSLEKQLKKKKQEFENNLPDLSLQLILMLNAGLVTSAAFKDWKLCIRIRKILSMGRFRPFRGKVKKQIHPS